jgi:hypothetical protein
MLRLVDDLNEITLTTEKTRTLSYLFIVTWFCCQYEKIHMTLMIVQLVKWEKFHSLIVFLDDQACGNKDSRYT